MQQSVKTCQCQGKGGITSAINHDSTRERDKSSLPFPSQQNLILNLHTKKKHDSVIFVPGQQLKKQGTKV
jgi:hypothetical protein